MTKKITRIAALAIGALIAGSVAGQAAIFAERVDWDGDTTGWISTPDKNTNRSDPANALGMADYTVPSEGGFLQLRANRTTGLGGIAVFDFGELFLTPANIFEVTFRCNGTGGVCTNFPETLEVLTTEDPYSASTGAISLSGFTSQGFIDNGDAQSGDGGGFVSLTVGGPFTYLALKDVSTSTKSSDIGFDVDAVSVSPVPLPAGIALLSLGLAGIGAVRVMQTRRTA